MMDQKMYMNYIHPSSLLRQLADLWRTDQLCDAVITVDKIIVAKAHKLLLFAVSSKVKADSANQSHSAFLDVCLPTGLSHKAVHAFLQYMYEGFLLLTSEMVKDMIIIAEYLEIGSLLQCCNDFEKTFKMNKEDSQEKTPPSEIFNHVRLMEVKQEPPPKRQIEEPCGERSPAMQQKRRKMLESRNQETPSRQSSNIQQSPRSNASFSSVNKNVSSSIPSRAVQHSSSQPSDNGHRSSVTSQDDAGGMVDLTESGDEDEMTEQASKSQSSQDNAQIRQTIQKSQDMDQGPGRGPENVNVKTENDDLPLDDDSASVIKHEYDDDAQIKPEPGEEDYTIEEADPSQFAADWYGDDSSASNQFDQSGQGPQMGGDWQSMSYSEPSMQSQMGEGEAQGMSFDMGGMAGPSGAVTQEDKKPFTCRVCSAVFLNKMSLEHHEPTHDKRTCERCGKSFTSNFVLASHLLSHMKQTGRGSYPCEICGKKYFVKSEFINHIKGHLDGDEGKKKKKSCLVY